MLKILSDQQMRRMSAQPIEQASKEYFVAPQFYFEFACISRRKRRVLGVLWDF